MGLTDSTYKKVKGTVQQVKKKTEGKEQQISEVFTAAERLLCHTVAHHWLIAKGKKSTNALVKRLIGVPASLGGMALRWNLMTDLAGAIDRLLEEHPAPVAEEIPVEEPVTEEVVEEAPTEEEPVAEEPAVETFAEVVEEVAPKPSRRTRKRMTPWMASTLPIWNLST